MSAHPQKIELMIMMMMTVEKRSTRKLPLLERGLLPSVLVYVIILCTSPKNCLAQELPIKGIELFERLDLRTNVCERQKQLNDNLMNIPNALSGLNLTAATSIYHDGISKNFFTLSEETGGIPEDYPGLIPVIMDELATRAGFRWRQSFGAFPPVSSESNATWTDVLKWQVNNFDIAMDYWLRTEERLAIGVAYPEAWYAGDIIIVQLVESNDETEFDILSFLSPFTYQLWGLIVLCIILSGMLYFCLDRLDNDADSADFERRPMGAVFSASMAFLGQNQFSPTTAPTRIMAFSLVFFSVLVISAYTANLASFLVASRRPPTSISSFDEANRLAITMCVLTGGPITPYYQKRFPNIQLVFCDSDVELIEKMRQKECEITSTNLAAFEVQQRLANLNSDCRLYHDGIIQLPSPAGFVTTIDTGNKCTSLINHVLDYHFIQMRLDGFLDDVWEDLLERVTDKRCPSPSVQSDDNDAGALGVKEMGGIFLFHGLLMAMSLSYALLTYFWRKSIAKRAKKSGDTQSNSRGAGELEWSPMIDNTENDSFNEKIRRKGLLQQDSSISSISSSETAKTRKKKRSRPIRLHIARSGSMTKQKNDKEPKSMPRIDENNADALLCDEDGFYMDDPVIEA